MLVVGFDTETTGLNVQEDHIIEVGAVLWDTERKAPMKLFSSLIDGSHIGKLSDEIVKLTGISNKDLKRFGESFKTVFHKLHGLFNEAEAIVAHNGRLFDKPIYTANCKRHGLEPIEKLWIDTVCDVEFPADMTTRKLKHLAAEHGFVNPFAHRALFDVLTMLRTVQDYSWQQIVNYAKAPTITIRANSTFQQKEIVKKQNFYWNNEQKIWFKTIKDFQLEAARTAAEAAGFSITVINGGQ